MSTSKWLFKNSELSQDNLDVDFSGENLLMKQIQAD